MDTTGWRGHGDPAFKTIFMARSEISINFHLAESISPIEPTLWGQRLVTANNKARNIQSFRLKSELIASERFIKVFLLQPIQ